MKHSLSEWRANAGALANWTISNLVNRSDCHGVYRSGKTFKLDNTVNRTLLLNHYAGIESIGLYTHDPSGMGKWCCIDLDAHGTFDQTVYDANHAKLGVILERCSHLGLVPLVEDSNGRGGIKVWVIFDSPVSIYSLRCLALQLAEGLSIPDIFPVQYYAESDKYGNYVRLIGRHPKWRSFSQIIGAQDTIGTILRHVPNSVTLIPQFPDIVLPDVSGGLRGHGSSTGDMWQAFCDDHSWEDILEPHGWEYVGGGKWKRPDNGIEPSHDYQATTNEHVFYCFSSNAAPFEKEGAYNKCTTAAYLNYNGDMTAFKRYYLERNYIHNLSTDELRWNKTNEANEIDSLASNVVISKSEGCI